MGVNADTHKIQSDLASYCRTDREPDLPGLAPNRVQQYRRLVYNIIDDTFEGAFPITRSFLNDEEWHGLIHEFFSKHQCQTPSVWKLPLEFYEFVMENPLELKIKYPFLTDLLYFEWLEIDVHTMPDIAYPNYSDKGDWLKDKIALNPEFKLLQFAYPVHQCKPAEMIANPGKGDYFVLIYRQPESGDVQFVNLSPLYTYVITTLSEGERDLNSIISEVCEVFHIDRNTEVDDNIIKFLNQMKTRQFVLGFIK